MTHPDVLIAHEGGRSVYMVASAHTPGAWYLVRFLAQDVPYPISCSCPAGEARPELSCRHMRAAVTFCQAENERHRRPVGPVNVSAMVD